MTAERIIQTTYSAKTDGFKRGTREVRNGLDRLNRSAERSLGEFDRRVNRSVKNIKRLGAAAAGLVAAAQFSQALGAMRQVVRRLDDIGKTADTIGLTTTQLQGLRQAFQDGGVQIGQTDKALLTFTRRLSQFREGMGAGKAAFEALGIETRRLDGSLKSNFEVLLEVADALRRIEDDTTRAGVAADLFDKRNARLLLTLTRGGDALEQSIDKMSEFGRVTSEEAVRAAEVLETELGAIESQIETEFNEALISSADILIAFAEAQLAAAQAAGTLLTAVGKTYSELKSLKIGDIEVLRLLRAAPGGIQLVGRSLARRALAEVDPVPAPQRPPDPSRPAGGSNSGAGRGAGSPFAGVQVPAPQKPRPNAGRGGGSGGAGGIREVRDAYAELIETAGARRQQLSDEIALARLFGEEQAILAEKQRLLADARAAGVTLDAERLAQIDAEAQGIATLRGELDALEAARRLIDETSQKMLTTEERIAEARRETEALLPQVIELLGDEARARELVARASADAARQIERDDGLNRLIDDIAFAVRGAEDLEDAFKRVGLQLAELVLTDAFKSLFGGSGGGGGGGGGSGGIFTALAEFVGSIFGGFLAGGGRALPGRAYVVGERRPELFVPDTAGTVLPSVPNMVQMPAAGGRGMAPVINIGGPVITMGNGVTPEQLDRALAKHRQETIRQAHDQLIRMNEHDPSLLHT